MRVDEQMDVVGHDDPREKVVAFAVKMGKTIFDKRANIRASEMAFAAAGIEPGLKLRSESFVIVFPIGFGPRFGMGLHPEDAFGLPLGEFGLGERVGEAECYPVSGAFL